MARIGSLIQRFRQRKINGLIGFNPQYTSRATKGVGQSGNA